MHAVEKSSKYKCITPTSGLALGKPNEFTRVYPSCHSWVIRILRPEPAVDLWEVFNGQAKRCTPPECNGAAGAKKVLPKVPTCTLTQILAPRYRFFQVFVRRLRSLFGSDSVSDEFRRSISVSKKKEIERMVNGAGTLLRIRPHTRVV